MPPWRLRSKSLRELAREWRYATEAILTFEPGGASAYDGAKVVRYEALRPFTRGEPDSAGPVLQTGLTKAFPFATEVGLEPDGTVTGAEPEPPGEG